MATKTMTAEARITAKDATGNVFSSIARKMDRLNSNAKQFNKSSAVMAAGARGGTGSALAAGALGIAGRVAPYLAPVAIAAAAGKAYADFAAVERRMTRIGVTAGASREEMTQLTAEAQRMAVGLALPFDQVADGFDTLAAQGRSLSEMKEMMPAIARTAQAAGAEVNDIALTAETVGSQFKIAGSEMQAAFDIMVAGGKAGQFELKSMARYLPSLGPAAAAVGFESQKGLSDLVAMLQIMRKGSGTAEEAVSSMNNVLNKMESGKTLKGLNTLLGGDGKAESAFAKARKEGRNLVEVFEDLVNTALKGDRSKIGLIADDQEFKRGILALMSYRGEWQKLSSDMRRNAPGSVVADLNTVLKDSQARLTRLGQSWDRFWTNTGKLVAIPANPALDWLNSNMEQLQQLIDGAPQTPINATTVGNTRASLEASGSEEAKALDVDIAALETEIAQIKGKNKLPDMLDFALGNRPGKHADLKNRRAGLGSGAANNLSTFEALNTQVKDLEAKIASGTRVGQLIDQFGGKAPATSGIVQGSFHGGTFGRPWGSTNPSGLPALNGQQLPDSAPIPPSRADNITPMLQRLEDVLAKPLDVSGKVEADVTGTISTTHVVRVEASADLLARVTSMSASSTGPIRSNVGTSMPHIKAGPR
ncbi:phage tail tape measure protein [Microvirga antarctica]|uniref:phage tail tape measure protein n=1 Tax=Microvirga antarctica TaxID=2819233 RepID=UPI001B307C4B|nr:phage tail tape measure protein [Microvirga antarctica]